MAGVISFLSIVPFLDIRSSPPHHLNHGDRGPACRNRSERLGGCVPPRLECSPLIGPAGSVPWCVYDVPIQLVTEWHVPPLEVVPLGSSSVRDSPPLLMSWVRRCVWTYRQCPPVEGLGWRELG